MQLQRLCFELSTFSSENLGHIQIIDPLLFKIRALWSVISVLTASRSTSPRTSGDSLTALFGIRYNPYHSYDGLIWWSNKYVFYFVHVWFTTDQERNSTKCVHTGRLVHVVGWFGISACVLFKLLMTTTSDYAAKHVFRVASKHTNSTTMSPHH